MALHFLFLSEFLMILGALALAMVCFEGHAEAQSNDTKQWSRFAGRLELSELLRLELGHQ